MGPGSSGRSRRKESGPVFVSNLNSSAWFLNFFSSDLGDDREMRAEVVKADFADVDAVDRDFAPGLFHDPEESQHQGRFSGSRPANHADLPIIGSSETGSPGSMNSVPR